MPYGQYLRSFEWKQTRRAALERANYVCAFCGDEGYLQVHYLTYERVGAEEAGDLLVLCDLCHSSISPVRKRLKAALKKLCERKGVEYEEPANQGAAKAWLADLEAMRDVSQGDPRYLNFYRLVAARQGDQWPVVPLGIMLGLTAERLAVLDALIPTLGPVLEPKKKEWDGVRTKSSSTARRGKVQ